LWWILTGGICLLRASWSSRQGFPAALNISSALQRARVRRTYSATPGTSSSSALIRSLSGQKPAPEHPRACPLRQPQSLQLTPRRSPNVLAQLTLRQDKGAKPRGGKNSFPPSSSRPQSSCTAHAPAASARTGLLHHTAERVAPPAIATRAVARGASSFCPVYPAPVPFSTNLCLWFVLAKRHPGIQREGHILTSAPLLQLTRHEIQDPIASLQRPMAGLHEGPSSIVSNGGKGPFVLQIRAVMAGFLSAMLR
jgi:hypothetical protein